MAGDDELGIVLYESTDELLGVVVSGASIGTDEYGKASLDDRHWPMEHIGRRIGLDGESTQFFDFEGSFVGRGILQPAADTDGGG